MIMCMVKVPTKCELALHLDQQRMLGRPLHASLEASLSRCARTDWRADLRSLATISIWALTGLAEVWNCPQRPLKLVASFLSHKQAADSLSAQGAEQTIV
jgi:hypothetical protein